MTALLFTLLLVLIFPFLVMGWRAMLLALSLQGLLMGWMVVQRGPVEADAAIPLLDLLIVRGAVVPLMLQRVMRARATGGRQDVRAPNLLSLMTLAVLVAAAFRFAGVMDPAGGESQVRLGVAAAGVLLGLFLLATQAGVFVQVVAVLYLENAIALFEFDRAAGVLPLPVELGLLLVFLMSAGIYVAYVERLSTFVATLPSDVADEGPTL